MSTKLMNSKADINLQGEDGLPSAGTQDFSQQDRDIWTISLELVFQ